MTRQAIKAANRAANGGKERKDLVSENWDGADYRGSNINILTVIVGLFVLVPLIGLVFAYFTWGTLWG